MDRPSAADMIAIAGLGLRLPGAESPADFWQNLRSGRSMLDEGAPVAPPRIHAPAARLDRVDGFDWRAFGIPPNQSRHIDPQHRLLLEVTWEALEDAGIGVRSLVGRKVAVFVGLQWNDYQRLQDRDPERVDAYSLAGNLGHFAAHRISHAFGFRGPSMVLDMGCASSLAAVHMACKALQQGDADLAIAGGVELALSPDATAMMKQAGLLDPSGHNRTLDRDAAGFARGEGAAVVVLERRSDVTAQDRIRAWIVGSAVNHNGANPWITAPSAIGQADVLREAWADARISGRDLGYVELHGTASPSGDATEARALGAALGPGPDAVVRVGSLKATLGHLGAASGIAAVAKLALAMWHDELPKSVFAATLNPELDFEALGLLPQTGRTAWPHRDRGRFAGITSISLSGANAHLVLSGADRVAARGPREQGPLPLAISATSQAALAANVDAMRQYLEAQKQAPDGASMADIAYTACARRSHHRERFIAEGSTFDAWLEALAEFLRAPQTWSSDHPFAGGQDFDFAPALPRDARLVTLPTYRWQRTSLWSAEAPVPEPSSDARHPLVSALCEVLGIDEEDVDPKSTPAAIGLDSLAALRLSHACERRTGVRLPVHRILEAPMLETLMAPLAPTSQRHPLTVGQQGFLLRDALDAHTQAHHVVLPLRLEGDLDVNALEGAFQAVSDRHPMLRAVFDSVDGIPFYRTPGSAVRWSITDGTDWTPSALQEHLAAEGSRPFHLATEPPFRIHLVAGNRPHLLLVAHHVAVDFWSLAIILDEVSKAYEALRSGKPWRPSPVEARFFEFVAQEQRYLASDAAMRALAHFQHALRDAPSLCSPPADRPRKAAPSNAGRTYRFSIDAACVRRLRALAAEEQATLFMVLTSALFVLLHRAGAGDDLTLGTPTARREEPRFSGVVGYFVNPIVLRAVLRAHSSFRDLLRDVRKTCLAAFAHQAYPFATLVEKLGASRDRSHHPLFQVLFALQQSQIAGRPDLSAFALCDAGARGKLGDLHVETIERQNRSAQFDLNFQMAPVGSELAGSIEYRTALYDESTIAEMASALQEILDAVADDPDMDVRASEQPRRVRAQPQHEEFASLIPAILDVARQRADAVAITGPGDHERLRYSALLERVATWSDRLRAVGVGRGHIVAIRMPTSADQVAAVLAILSMGAAMLPLDPEHPDERTRWMVEDAQAAALVDETGVTKLPGGAEDRDLAYVMYTSGSTGRPKGVMVDHLALAAEIRWRQSELPLRPDDRILLLASPAFDIFVWELLGPLFAGAQIVIPPAETRHNQHQLAARIERGGVTVLQMVSSALSRMLEDPSFASGDQLRLVITGGDALTADVADRLVARGDIELVHLYGPTEAVIDATCFRHAPGRTTENGVVPIGAPVDGVEIYLVDSQLRRVPRGTPGEIAIGGALSRGYIGRADLTADRFLPNPFSGSGTRMYLTGDFAWEDSDGTFHFLGRQAQQVKIRGHRVELGEVEAVIALHPMVGEQVVVARGTGSDARLVAWVAAASHQRIIPSEVRDHLASRLPWFMLPSDIVVLDALPRLQSGKVDRKAIEAMDAERASAARSSGFGSYTEELVAEAFGALLGRSDVPPEANFFELGGHSLLALRAAARLSALASVAVDVRAIFEHPTVRGLGAWLASRPEDGKAPAPPIAAENRTEHPLSAAQEGLWLVHALEPESLSFTIPVALRLSGPLNADRLVAAIRNVVARHQSLRTRFEPADDSARAVVEDVGRFQVTREDLSQADDPEQALWKLIRREERRGFDLALHPPFRACLARLADRDHALLINTHHIVCDGWSHTLLLDEIGALYAGQPLTDVILQYGDFALWEQRRRAQGAGAHALDYWRKTLTGARSTPLAMTSGPKGEPSGTRGTTHLTTIEGEALAPLRDLCRDRDATLFMGLTAAMAVVLYRFCGATDIVIGTPVARRERPELEHVVGLFVNLLPLRIDLTGDPSFEQVITLARTAALGAYTHGEVALAEIARAVSPSRMRGEVPLIRVELQLATQPAPSLQLDGIDASSMLAHYSVPPPYLSVTATPQADGLQIRALFDGDRFDSSGVEDLLEWFRKMVSEAPKVPEARVGVLLRSLEREDLPEDDLFAFERDETP